MPQILILLGTCYSIGRFLRFFMGRGIHWRHCNPADALFNASCFRQLFIIYYAFHNLLGNHALWLAFITYLSLRGIVQTFIGREIVKKAI